MTNELINILEQVKGFITDDANMLWTGYDTAKELRDELETYICQLKNENTECLRALYFLFGPTSVLQDHAIDNAWSADYLQLSGAFDNIYVQLR